MLVNEKLQTIIHYPTVQKVYIEKRSKNLGTCLTKLRSVTNILYLMI